MLYAPPLWPGEMLSSLFTRISAYYGFSQRRTVFGFFDVWSVINPMFPRRLRTVAKYLGSEWSGRRLLLEHTFYPLAAPFLEKNERRMLAANMLCARLGAQTRKKSNGVRGLRLQTYRYCPLCWAEQNERMKGDCGWLREWQIPELTLCLKHGTPLWDTGEPFQDSHKVPRNLACGDIDLSKARPLEPDRHSALLLETAGALLTTHPPRLPDRDQWTAFWEKKLEHLTSEELAEAGADYWGVDWLQAHGIDRINKSLLLSTDRRIWWKNLLLLKAAAPEATLQEAIREAAWTRKLKDNF